MINQMIQREFKGAGLDLVGKHNGQKARVAINGFVVRHGDCAQAVGFAVGAIASFIVQLGRRFLHSLNAQVNRRP